MLPVFEAFPDPIIPKKSANKESDFENLGSKYL